MKNNIKQYKVIYVGGAVDHIILPIISEFYEIYKDNFLFISTCEKPRSRVNIGYDFSKLDLPYVKKSYKNKKDFKCCKKLIKIAKVVIYQNVKDRAIIRPRLFSSKITFKCTERFFKSKTTWKNFLHRILGTIFHYHLFNKRNKYVLCMGGYVAQDLKKTHLFKGKMLTWGYFTDTTSETFENLVKIKSQNKQIQLCWVGRFIEEKQPIMVLKLAQFLKAKNVDFDIKMGGYGPLEERCKNYIIENNLEDKVQLLGALTLEDKEKLMNASNCFLFTSTREEGWGAVVNEAMGSACLCFASKESGSSKTLINDSNNGFLFSCEHQEELNNIVFSTLINGINYKITKNAFDDIKTYWNSKVAVKRLSRFIDNLLKYGKIIFEDYGPCSEAK